MLPSLLLTLVAVVPLLLALLLLPALLLRRFLSIGAVDDADEVDDGWALLFSDSSSSYLPVERATA